MQRKRRLKKYKPSGYCPDLTRIKKMEVFCKSVIGLAFVFSLAFPSSSIAQLSPGPGSLYPYVIPGSTIVVCRDEFDGLRTPRLFSRRLSSDALSIAQRLESASSQQLPAQFEVRVDAGSFNHSTALQCSSPWRVPTYRETLLIWLLKDELAISVDGWTATANVGPDDCGFFVYWHGDEVFSCEEIGFYCDPINYRLCIRDIDTKSLGLSDL